MHGSAWISDCGVYRYRLHRWWGEDTARRVCWVMLNPSTADGKQDDPTIRRLIEFSRRWGFDALTVVNLFALRSTSPSALRCHPDPVGPRNDEAVDEATAKAELVVCAWGAHGTIQNRSLLVRQRLVDLDLRCLGRTVSGQPCHPLYRPNDQPLIPYEPTA